MQFSVSDVATNVAKRLSNWQKVGLENVFCEAVLILATAEYLKEPCGYQIAAEAQACNLFPGIGTKPGEINYDLHSTKENHKIIWEMKFLKKPNDQRIIYDLAKLALPEAVSDCQRFFLVAANGRARSNLVDRMNAAHSYTFDIIRDTEHELVCRSMPAVGHGGQTESLTSGGSLRSVEKLMGASRQQLRFRVDLRSDWGK